MSLGSWGPVIFEVSTLRARTWQAMKRSGEARWKTHDVHAGKPLAEFIGPGVDALNLTVRLDAALGMDPEAELATLRGERDAGSVNQLVIGGKLVFDAILKNLGEDHVRHDSKGRLLLAIAELAFEEYAATPRSQGRNGDGLLVPGVT